MTSRGLLIQKEIDESKEVLAGLDYITEDQTALPNFECSYICKLCDATCNRSVIFNHILGVKHRMKYIDSVDKEAHETLKTLKVKRSELSTRVSDCVEELVKKFGPGRVKIQKREEPSPQPKVSENLTNKTNVKGDAEPSDSPISKSKDGRFAESSVDRHKKDNPSETRSSEKVRKPLVSSNNEDNSPQRNTKGSEFPKEDKYSNRSSRRNSESSERISRNSESSERISRNNESTFHPKRNYNEPYSRSYSKNTDSRFDSLKNDFETPESIKNNFRGGTTQSFGKPQHSFGESSYGSNFQNEQSRGNYFNSRDSFAGDFNYKNTSYLDNTRNNSYRERHGTDDFMEIRPYISPFSRFSDSASKLNSEGNYPIQNPSREEARNSNSNLEGTSQRNMDYFRKDSSEYPNPIGRNRQFPLNESDYDRGGRNRQFSQNVPDRFNVRGGRNSEFSQNDRSDTILGRNQPFLRNAANHPDGTHRNQEYPRLMDHGDPVMQRNWQLPHNTQNRFNPSATEKQFPQSMQDRMDPMLARNQQFLPNAQDNFNPPHDKNKQFSPRMPDQDNASMMQNKPLSQKTSDCSDQTMTRGQDNLPKKTQDLQSSSSFTSLSTLEKLKKSEQLMEGIITTQEEASLATSIVEKIKKSLLHYRIQNLPVSMQEIITQTLLDGDIQKLEKIIA